MMDHRRYKGRKSCPNWLKLWLKCSPAARRKTQSAQAPPKDPKDHAITMATRTTRTGNALVQPQKLSAILAQQALRLRTSSNLRNSRPSWPRIGAPDNRPRKVIATISNVSNENTNQPVLVTKDNPSIVSFSMNKVCAALGYTGLAPSIANECGIINISRVFAPILIIRIPKYGDAVRALDKFHSDLRLSIFSAMLKKPIQKMTPYGQDSNTKTSAALPVGNHPVDRPP